MNDKIELFISYSHKDEELRDQLDTSLASLKWKGIVSTWHDRQIPAGSEWSGDIDKNLKKADIILLLISPDFIASKYCYEIELQEAMNRHKKGEAIVIPIILRPAEWTDMSFGMLQAFPKDAKPVTTWPNRDAAFKNIAAGIRKVVKELHKKRQELAEQKEANKSRYKQKVEELLLRTGGEIGIVERRTLDELREELKLTLQEALKIESEAFLPIEEYRKNILLYEDTLRDLLENGESYPFSEKIRKSLEGRQQDKGIMPVDAERAKFKVLEEFNIEPIQDQSTDFELVKSKVATDVATEIKINNVDGSGTKLDETDIPVEPTATETKIADEISSVRAELVGERDKEVTVNGSFSVNERIKNFGLKFFSNPKKLTVLVFGGVLLGVYGVLAVFLRDVSLDKEIKQKFSSELLDRLSLDGNRLLKDFDGPVNVNPEEKIHTQNKKLANREICNGKSYTVAVPVPTSGKEPGKAAEMLRGFAQAQNKINEECAIRGGGLRLLIVDDADDPEVGRRISEEILKLNNILAVVGHWTSNVSLEAAKVYKDELVLITPISILDDLEGYDYVFRMNPASKRGAEKLSQYLSDNGYIKTSVVYASENDYANELTINFRNEFEKHGEVIQEISFDSLVKDDDSVQSNVTDPFLQDVNGAAKALVLFPSIRATSKAIKLLEYIDDNDLSGDISVVGDMANLYTPDALKQKAALDMVLAIPWHFDSDPSGFACEAYNFWNKKIVNHATAMSYFGLIAVAEAIKETNSSIPFFNSPSRSSIYMALKSGTEVDYSDSKALKFEQNGVSNLELQLVKVQDTSLNPERASTSGANVDFDFVPIHSDDSEIPQKNCPI
ncbi:TIR domain-containing protein [Leptolyngbyaceae cyanobacterium CCMR0082]|uniref:TIR domain-containing protein n=1 Tax=Adonisia turfae CCMR0082 TaxID=2304604 RepID=A0A6M0SH74_9CYAN|nr:TIR domain-containing protein [Adonisia turfae]MDV3347931.1 ABC transporter substrate-binding protein [Leptothoe sp. LEGE 181152]NEZ67666.1 TIR domain-containing protein [Adonisia turfae CCMR0082]